MSNYRAVPNVNDARKASRMQACPGIETLGGSALIISSKYLEIKMNGIHQFINLLEKVKLIDYLI